MKREKKHTLLTLYFVFTFILSVAGCGSDSNLGDVSNDSGAIAAKISWSNEAKKAVVLTESAVPAGVVTVRIIVSGDGMTDVQKDFASSAGQGTVDYIPPGSSRTVTAKGLDAGGNLLAQGTLNNITIVAGQTTDAGTITLTASSAPSTPTGLIVSAYSSSQINLSWTVPSGIVIGYKIYKNGTFLKNVTTTSTSDRGLSPSTNYCYSVSAYNSVGESSRTRQICATTDSPPLSVPSTPTGFSAIAASSSQINLDWNESTGAAGYRVYKGGTLLKSVTTTSTTDTGLSPTTNYCYSVSAYNSAGESSRTSQICLTPLPGGSGEVKVTLQWHTCVDLDLYVIDPCGNSIYYAKPSAGCQTKTGYLDVDSNAACTECLSSPAENIYWSTAPTGTYTVQVKVYNMCSVSGSTSYTVTTIVDGVPERFSGSIMGSGNRQTIATFSR